MSEDERFMRRALELARRGWGETNPNPLVGCVLVRAGRVVGEGFHRRAGAPHAEAEALGRAGDRARGATAYVNLEPCAHTGRTPPCAPRLVEAGVARVVAAVGDPHPRVSGRGFRRLRAAGVAVRTGVLASEARSLNERFLLSARARRPFVLLKVALTLDGRIAARGGDSRWVTGARERAQARWLRRGFDAVAVGVGTVLADDPRLVPVPAVSRPFARVVFDSRYRTPPASRLLRTPRAGPVWIVGGPGRRARRAALAGAGARVLAGPAPGGRVRLDWALAELRRQGVTGLMVEGGGELLGSFLAARAFDRVALFRAPKILGGRESRPAFGGPNPERMRDALALRALPAPAWWPGEGTAPLFELWGPRRR
jgi:diaminohydroxyphosphoribosylaminopyrimidine deaminase/5-amino-6-(5-phosphoribosylamino)uracil reductase